jgi:hypothetical protein
MSADRKGGWKQNQFYEFVLNSPKKQNNLCPAAESFSFTMIHIVLQLMTIYIHKINTK